MGHHREETLMLHCFFLLIMLRAVRLIIVCQFIAGEYEKKLMKTSSNSYAELVSAFIKDIKFEHYKKMKSLSGLQYLTIFRKQVKMGPHLHHANYY